MGLDKVGKGEEGGKNPVDVVADGYVWFPWHIEA